MSAEQRKLVAYVMNQTVVIGGRVFERGSVGPAEEYGEAFPGLLTAGFLNRIDLGVRPSRPEPAPYGVD